MFALFERRSVITQAEFFVVVFLSNLHLYHLEELNLKSSSPPLVLLVSIQVEFCGKCWRMTVFSLVF